VAKKVKKAVKKVTKPVTKLASSATKVITSALKIPTSLFAPKVDIPDQKLPAPPAPDAEQYAEGMSTPENIGRRRRRGGRSGLRIDLNTGGGGTGVNVAVG
jgi:hypothetical protein